MSDPQAREYDGTEECAGHHVLLHPCCLQCIEESSDKLEAENAELCRQLEQTEIALEVTLRSANALLAVAKILETTAEGLSHRRKVRGRNDDPEGT